MDLGTESGSMGHVAHLFEVPELKAVNGLEPEVTPFVVPARRLQLRRMADRATSSTQHSHYGETT